MRFAPVSVLVAIATVLVACSDTRSSGSGADDADVATIPEDGGTDDDARGASDAATGSDADDATGGDAATDGDSDQPCEGLGCPCEADADCASGYCIGTGAGDLRVCTELCDGDCPDGYTCELIENAAGDAVRLCVPERSPYCQPCERDVDCGSLRHLCLEQNDGRFCATACLPGDVCPDGALCDVVTTGGQEFRICVPDDGVCSVCVDEDGDLHGLGSDCMGTDCDDTRDDVYEGAAELCDERDNDCDGFVDEGFDLDTDPDHCGACGEVCELDNAIAVCREGRCEVGACETDYGDCDEDPENGCETDLAAPGSCGACIEAGGTPGTSCGTCDTGTWICGDDGRTTCEGDRGEAALNECGGCAVLEGAIGAPCGTCDSGGLACEDDGEALVCEGDLGDDALTACGACPTEDACAPGDVESGGPCEGCGTLERVCNDACGWDAWTCDVAPICTPGDVETERRDCGDCGEGLQTRTRTCNAEGCAWSDWAEWSDCATAATCAPGESETDIGSCGACDEGTRDRTRSCNAETCTWDGYGPWSACDTDAVCSPGTSETERRTCGNCDFGSQSRTRACNPDTCAYDAWDEWTECVGGGACSPGETLESDCGNCGTLTNTCSAVCTWVPGACVGEGECAPGATTNDGCDSICALRSCSGTCSWSNACTLCGSCSTVTLCGNSCPDGFYARARGESRSCSDIGTGNNVTCAPICGLEFTACSSSCPDGYYARARSESTMCSRTGTGNNVTCRIVDGLQFTVCGSGCPDGYVPIASGSSPMCSSIGSGNTTTCRLL